MGVYGRHEAHDASNERLPRRGFLKQLAASAVAISWSSRLRAQEGSGTLEVSDTVIAALPEGFTGLSHESSELSDPNFFSAGNRTLSNLLRGLGSKGVLRIGGTSSEFTFWQAPGIENPTKRGAAPTTLTTAGRQSQLKRLRTLPALEMADWKLIYGLNLIGGDVASAVDEAVCVSRAVGERLVAFQLGNEPDGQCSGMARLLAGPRNSSQSGSFSILPFVRAFPPLTLPGQMRHTSMIGSRGSRPTQGAKSPC